MVRKAIAKKIEADVLHACRRRCAICFGLHGDLCRKQRGQIAHLDRNAANSSFDNLVFLCLEHHDEYDSKTSQSKGLTPDEVRRFRHELVTVLAAEHQPPSLNLTTDRVAPAPAPTSERLTIRELSAADILAALRDITLDYRFRERVEELYLGRWTRDPGWRATVHDLPNRISESWYCSFSEVVSGTLVWARTDQDISALRRGDSVIVSGRISAVSRLQSVNLEDAIVRNDDGTAP